MDLHIRRQDLAVQFFRLGLDAFQDILRLLASQHQNDAFHGVIVVLEAELAQARSMADGDFADVPHPHRNPFVGADDDVGNVIRIPDQADAAHIVELSTLRIETAAGIRVVRRESLRRPAPRSGDSRKVALDRAGPGTA